MKLRYAVVTSVTRDDLKDGGAFFSRRLSKHREKTPETKVEVLIPDFRGDLQSLKTVLGGPAGCPESQRGNSSPSLCLCQTWSRVSSDLRSSEERASHRIRPYLPSRDSCWALERDPKRFSMFWPIFPCGGVAAILTLGQYLQPSSSASAV